MPTAAVKKQTKGIRSYLIFKEAPRPPLESSYPYPFWSYVHFDQHKQQIVFDWLDHNKKEIQTLPPNFQETIRFILKSLGVPLHPSLGVNCEATSESGETFHYITFQKIKVDWISLHMVHTFSSQLNLQVLIFKDNMFEADEIVKLFALLRDSRVQKLIIQNNPIDPTIHLEHPPLHDKNPLNPADFYPKLAILSSLEFLVLKDNGLTDDFVAAFVEQSKHIHNSNLKHLDLGNNQIAKPGCDSLAELMSSQNNLVYLGLEGNPLRHHNEIKSLLSRMGRHKIHLDEVTKIQELEQQREAQIQKFTKAKKKYTEDMLPQVPKYVQVDGTYFILENPAFQILNLSNCGFSDGDKEFFEKFLYHQAEPFLVVLDQNLFEEATRQRFKKKFKKVVLV